MVQSMEVEWVGGGDGEKCCTNVYLFEKLLNKTWTMRKIVNFTVLLDDCCWATVLLSWSLSLSSVIPVVFALFTVRIFIRSLCVCVLYLYLRILMFHYELNCNSSMSFCFCKRLSTLPSRCNILVPGVVCCVCVCVCVFLCVVQSFFLLLLVIVLLFSGARFLRIFHIYTNCSWLCFVVCFLLLLLFQFMCN